MTDRHLATKRLLARALEGRRSAVAPLARQSAEPTADSSSFLERRPTMPGNVVATDAAALEEVVQRHVSHLLQQITTTPTDSDGLNIVLQEAVVSCFLPLSLQTVQLWGMTSAGNNSLTILRPDGVRASIATGRLLEFLLASVSQSEEILPAVSCFRVKSHDSLWIELERSMRSYYAFYQRTLKGDDSFTHRRWSSISVTRIVSESTTFVLLAAEAAASPFSRDTSVSMSLPGVVQPTNNKILSLLAQQVLEQVGWALLANSQTAEIRRGKLVSVVREERSAFDALCARSVLQLSKELRECTGLRGVGQCVASRALLSETPSRGRIHQVLLKTWCIIAPTTSIGSADPLLVFAGHKAAPSSSSSSRSESSSAALRAFLSSTTSSEEDDLSISIVSREELLKSGLCSPDETELELSSYKLVRLGANSTTSLMILLLLPPDDVSSKSRDINSKIMTQVVVDYASALRDEAHQALQRLSQQSSERLVARMGSALRGLCYDIVQLTSSSSGISGTGELEALCRSIRSDPLTRAFGCKRSALLLCGSVLGQPESDEASFNLYDPSSSLATGRPVNAHPLSKRDALWLQELETRRIVRVGEGSEASVRHLVRVIDAEAVSAVLLAIQAGDTGLCVLVLVLNEDSEIQPTGEYLKALQSSGIANDIAMAINISSRLNSSREALQLNVVRGRKLLAVGPLILSGHRRASLGRTLSRWRRATAEMRLHEQQRWDEMLIVAALELSSCRTVASAIESSTSSSSSTARSRSRFLSAAEQWAIRLFPFDSVVSSYSVVLGSEEKSPDTVPSLDSHGRLLSKSIITGHVDCVSSSHRIGTIQVHRSAFSRPFAKRERDTLSRLCQIASAAYQTYKHGHSVLLLSEGVTSGPQTPEGGVLPCLTEVLPLLLNLLAANETNDIDKNDPVNALHDALPLVARALKRVCGASTALLRLQMPSAANSKKAGELEEAIVSSEDRPHSHSVATATATRGKELLHSAVATLASASGELKLRLRLSGLAAAAEVIGEVSVLSNNGDSVEAEFLPEQRATVELLSYTVITVSLIALRIRGLGLSVERYQDLCGEMQATLARVARESESHKLSSELHSRHLAQATEIFDCLSLTQSAIQSTSTLAEFAASFDVALARVLGVDSVVLLLRRRRTEGPADTSSTSFDYVQVSTKRNSNSNSDSPSIHSAESLLALPTFPRSPSSASTGQPAAFFLTRMSGSADMSTEQEASVPFACVLLPSMQHQHQHQHQMSLSLWHGMQSAISAILSQAIERFALLQRPLPEVVARDQARLQSAALSMQAALAEAQAETQSLQMEARRLVEQHRAEKEDTSEAAKQAASEAAWQVSRLGDQISALESDAEELRRLHAVTLQHRHSLVSLVSFFSSDPSPTPSPGREHGETTLQWLRKYSDTRACNILTLTLTEKGSLLGGGGIRGVLKSASEALRTGSAVEMFGFMSPRPEEEKSSEASQSVVALCVPNRCLPPIPSAGGCNYAVFVFFRPAASQAESFSDHDKELLACAANLAARVLLRASLKYNSEEFRVMHVQNARAMQARNKYQLIATICESYLWGRAAHTRSDAIRQIENAAVQLMTREYLTNDPCHVDAFLWVMPWTAASTEGAQIRSGDLSVVYSALSGLGFGAEVDLAQAVLSKKKSIRRGGVTWVAVKMGDEVSACLRVERRLLHDVDVESLPGGLHENSQPMVGASVTLADVVITQEEEETLEVLCRLLYPTLDRVDEAERTVEGLQSASSAMTALLQAKSELEADVGIERRHRQQACDCLDAGLALMSTARGRGASALALLESFRIALLAATQSHECCILIPPGADILLELWDPSSLVSSLPEISDTSTTHSTSSDGQSLPFLHLDTNPRAVINPNAQQVVYVEPGDSEAAAVKQGTVSAAPDGGFWRSWAGRKVHNSRPAGSGTGLLAMSVPIALVQRYLNDPLPGSSGGHVGVASVVRIGETPFSDLDRRCALLLVRSLAAALDTLTLTNSSKTARTNVSDGDGIAVSDTSHPTLRMHALHREVGRLQVLVGRAAAIEREEQLLVNDLTRAASSFPVADLPSLIKRMDADENDDNSGRESATLEMREMVLCAARQCFSHVVLEQQPSTAAAFGAGRMEDVNRVGTRFVESNSPETVAISSGGAHVGRITYWTQTRRPRDLSSASTGRLASESESTLDAIMSSSSQIAAEDATATTQLVLSVQHRSFSGLGPDSQPIRLLAADCKKPQARLALLLRLLDYQENIMVQSASLQFALQHKAFEVGLGKAATQACLDFQERLLAHVGVVGCPRSPRSLGSTGTKAIRDGEDSKRKVIPSWLQDAFVDTLYTLAEQSRCGISVIVSADPASNTFANNLSALTWHHHPGNSKRPAVSQDAGKEAIIKSRRVVVRLVLTPPDSITTTTSSPSAFAAAAAVTESESRLCVFLVRAVEGLDVLMGKMEAAQRTALGRVLLAAPSHLEYASKALILRSLQVATLQSQHQKEKLRVRELIAKEAALTRAVEHGESRESVLASTRAVLAAPVDRGIGPMWHAAGAGLLRALSINSRLLDSSGPPLAASLSPSFRSISLAIATPQSALILITIAQHSTGSVSEEEEFTITERPLLLQGKDDWLDRRIASLLDLHASSYGPNNPTSSFTSSSTSTTTQHNNINSHALSVYRYQQRGLGAEAGVEHWLVPVRTTGTSVGGLGAAVMRLDVKSSNTRAAAPSSEAMGASGVQYVDVLSVTPQTEALHTLLQGFTEAISPILSSVLLAARRDHELFQTQQTLQRSLSLPPAASLAERQSMAAAIAQGKHREEIMRAASRVIGEFCGRDLYSLLAGVSGDSPSHSNFYSTTPLSPGYSFADALASANFNSENALSTDVSTCVRDALMHLAAPLQEVLRGSVRVLASFDYHGESDEGQGEAKGDEGKEGVKEESGKIDASVSESPLLVLRQRLIDDRGQDIGSLVVDFSSSASGHSQYVNDSFASPTDRQAHIVCVQSLLQPLASLVSGSAQALYREYSTQASLRETINGCAVLCKDLERTVGRAMGLADKNLSSQKVVGRYRRLSGIVAECLAWTAVDAIPSPSTSPSSEGGGATETSVNMLQNICDSLPAFLDGPCTVLVGLFESVDDGEISSLLRGGAHASGPLWLHTNPSSQQQDKTNAFAASELPPATLELCRSIALNCMHSKRSRSCIEVSLPVSHRAAAADETFGASSQHIRAARGLKLTSCPLVIQERECIGVLQVIELHDGGPASSAMASATNSTLTDEVEASPVSAPGEEKEVEDLIESMVSYTYEANQSQDIPELSTPPDPTPTTPTIQARAASLSLQTIRTRSLSFAKLSVFECRLLELNKLWDKLLVEGKQSTWHDKALRSVAEACAALCEGELGGVEGVISVRVADILAKSGLALSLQSTSTDSLVTLTITDASVLSLPELQLDELKDKLAAMSVLLRGAIAGARAASFQWQREQQQSQQLSRDCLGVLSGILSHSVMNMVRLVGSQVLTLAMEEVTANTISASTASPLKTAAAHPLDAPTLTEEAMAAFVYRPFIKAVTETITVAAGGNSLVLVDVSLVVADVGGGNTAGAGPPSRSAVAVRIYNSQIQQATCASLLLTGDGSCCIERCIFSGGTQTNAPFAEADLVGVSEVASPSSDDGDGAPTPLCCAVVMLPTQSLQSSLPVHILRVVYRWHERDSRYASTLSKKLLLPLMSMSASVFSAATDTLIAARAHRLAQQASRRERDVAQKMLERMRKVVQLACRESTNLLGNWDNEENRENAILRKAGTNPPPWHPINLPPISCLETTLRGVLTTCSALVRCDGLAVVLRQAIGSDSSIESAGQGKDDDLDEDSAAGQSLRILSLGGSIRWDCEEASAESLWTLPLPRRSGGDTGLINFVTRTGKAVLAANAPLDVRYNRLVDGAVTAGTALLLVPIWGRESRPDGGRQVCGVLMLARKTASSASAFTSEELVAAELVCAMSSGALFWLEGLTLQWTESNKMLVTEEEETASASKASLKEKEKEREKIQAKAAAVKKQQGLPTRRGDFSL